MDCSGRIWMTFTKIDAMGAYSLLGTFGRGFGRGQNIFEVQDNNENLSHPFPGHWGAGWDGWRRVGLDDVF